MKFRRFSQALAGMLLAGTSALAQTETPTTVEGWAARAEKFSQKIPQEHVFIHMDNSCYFLSDTIYYKAYVTLGDKGLPSKLSHVLYAELLNHDGYLVERQLLELKNGTAEGSFCLPDTLYSGYYELRAYTRWQLNWGEFEHPHTRMAEDFFFNKKQASYFYRDYEKLYSRVFPVYDKPQNPGEYYHDMTLRPMRRVFKAENSTPKAVLTCYPEGGNLVAGTACRVAFEAGDEEGKHVQGTITLRDARGQTVAQTKTGVRGRAALDFTPLAGAKYQATLEWEHGQATLDLPDVEADGCAVRVEQEGGKVLLSVAPAGGAAQEELGFTVMHHGRQLLFQPLEKSGLQKAELPTGEWPSGVMQLTVFNARGRIYADRLFFLRQPGLVGQNLKFEGVEEQYQPFAPIEMRVTGGKPDAVLSVSVRDAGLTEYIHDDASILSEMLLCSQIRGFVENPDYYFQADDEERRQALDLLLMIQGWRRYGWHTLAKPGEFVLQHAPEKTQLLHGEVNTYKLNSQKDELRADMSEDPTTAADRAVTYEPTENRKSTAERDISRQDDTPVTPLQRVRDRFVRGSNLKREMLLHAEFTKPGAEEGVVGEMMTKKGMFTIECPRFFEQCYFFLAASDCTKWKNGAPDTWVYESEDKDEALHYPEFYVKINPAFPRFVKPYSWYQCNLADVPANSAMNPEWLNDGSRTLATVTVGAKRNRLLRLDASKPAFVVDAYVAFNEACDAGFTLGVFPGGKDFAEEVARTYVGDMNMERQYEVERRYDTHTEGHFTSDYERNKYNHLPYLDKVYIYTDYSPRREGDKKFEQSNQPTVTVDLRTLPGGTRRATFRDRRYVLQGFAVCEDFYRPDYTNKPLPEHKDYRRTLFWDPFVKLEPDGSAQIRFFNNGRTTQVGVSAEGLGADGTLYTGRQMPEDRKQ